MIEKLVVRGITDVKSFNAEVRKVSGKFPSQLDEGTKITVYPSKNINADNVLALANEASYLAYKNKIDVMAMTKKGLLPLLGVYLRMFLDKKHVSVVNLTAPTSNNRIIWPVFKAMVTSTEKLLSTTTEVDVNVPVKPGSSYNGDFMSPCDASEATSVSRLHYSNKVVASVGVNLIVPENSFKYVWMTARHRLTNYAINGKCVSRTYYDPLDEYEKDIQIVEYLLEYDKDVFYDIYHVASLDNLKWYAKTIINDPCCTWFTRGCYDRDEFIKALEYFIIKYSEGLSVEKLINTLSFVDHDMEIHGRYQETDVFYEDSHKENEEEGEN